MGVLVGVFPGGWLCAHSDYCTMGQQTLALVHSSAPVAVAIVLAKLVLGKEERTAMQHEIDPNHK